MSGVGILHPLRALFFVALARELGVALVTTDTRVLNHFPDTAHSPEKFSA